MTLTPRLQQAINHASRLHRNQVRRDAEETPYFSHLVSVAIIVSEFTRDEDVLVAALLHDLLEDVPNVTKEDIDQLFGKKVGDIVYTLTEPKPNILGKSVEEYWYERKKAYLNSLKNGSDEALLVAAGDKIHNMRSMREGVENKGIEHLRKFVSGALEKQFWFYTEVDKIVNEKLSKELMTIYRTELKEFEKIKNQY